MSSLELILSAGLVILWVLGGHMYFLFVMHEASRRDDQHLVDNVARQQLLAWLALTIVWPFCVFLSTCQASTKRNRS